MNIMQGNQFSGQDLMAIYQMPQIGPREVPAGIALTIFLNRLWIQPVTRVPEDHKTVACEGRPVPSVARRIHAIEHIGTSFHGFKEIRRRADSHQIARFIGRHPRQNIRKRLEHFGLGLTDAQAPERVSVKTDLKRPLKRFPPQIFESSSLNNAKERLRLERVTLLGSGRPPQGYINGLMLNKCFFYLILKFTHLMKFLNF